MMVYPFLFLFVFVLFLSTVIGLSSSHWLMVWMALELNMLSFIPVMSSSSWFQETEGCIKYFMFQAFGSSVLLLGSLSGFFFVFIIFGLLIKLGVAPFHYWFPSVMSSCSWFVCGLLMTWQKLLPMLLLIYFFDSYYCGILVFVGVLSSLVGGFGGLNQTQLRPLLGYSSISHMGWILSGASVSKSVGVFYLFIYFLISVCIVWLFFMLSLSFSFFKFGVFHLSLVGVILLVMIFLSLGGVPPFTGFFAKWLVIYFLESPLFIFFLLVGSLMNLYYYLNICFSAFVGNSSIVFGKGNLSFSFLFFFLCFLSLFGVPLFWYAVVLFYKS